MRSTTAYPPAVPGWLTDGGRRRVLDLGSGRGALAAMLAADGHEVFCLDEDLYAVNRLAARVDADQLGLNVVAGQAESLPFADRSFDVVTAAQNLHHFAPGLALAEIARVLVPGGQLAVTYNTRDDTVPWVKRLTRLVQQYDPAVMQGDFGHGSIDWITDSPYFDEPRKRSFRNWIPATRPQMLAMVERSQAVAGLSEAQRAELLQGVGELYDANARPPEPLLLPWQTTCWRAEVDHTEVVFTDDESGLDIPLDF
ncbi:methyltransferase domain-containing protein [Propionibacteriaceae bacterium Y1700]|uniref:class I SAM-dependent methyltransferase n=1 Tax=Microlunatus sp. Y1700 TaxID=3418487 RepID=UPI003DA705A2